jgi:hypothetical protein
LSRFWILEFWVLGWVLGWLGFSSGFGFERVAMWPTQIKNETYNQKANQQPNLKPKT